MSWCPRTLSQTTASDHFLLPKQARDADKRNSLRPLEKIGYNWMFDWDVSNLTVSWVQTVSTGHAAIDKPMFYS